ncbi:mitochondrial fission process protein 1 [Limosa lapponica baueri]|uniref:Mitochondrial fission process protein 1 n=1 Tax=Limosa lapponica baueri TaxID=1758121 RepID=A0A2I0U9B2_LIMLA|nr:mitochondrial fission process protein 1 [Limosa lapponica baueri]
MGNKQEELEAIVLLGSYNVVAITETWWVASHDWIVAIDGYRLFRRDRRRRKHSDIALYIKKWIKSEELSQKNSHDQVESIWVRIRDRENKGNLVAGVHYGFPVKGAAINKAFLL